MLYFKKIKNFFISKKNVYEIQSNKELHLLEKTLKKEKLFCIDTEFDWRTTYIPKLSLIQIGFKKEIFIIDCLKLNPAKILIESLESDEYLKIFHSVKSDTIVLKNCLNISTKNVFDVQIAEKKLNKGKIESYAKIVLKYIGKKLDKTETNSNWLKRPLKESQIRYAVNDVKYLIEIFELQKKLLDKRNKLNETLQDSALEAKLGNQDIKISRLKRKKKKLNDIEKKIFLWRENLARKENIPPGYLFKDKYLSELSRLSKDDTKLKKRLYKIIGNSKWTENFIFEIL
jgi:ribonuclease D